MYIGIFYCCVCISMFLFCTACNLVSEKIEEIEEKLHTVSLPIFPKFRVGFEFQYLVWK